MKTKSVTNESEASRLEKVLRNIKSASAKLKEITRQADHIRGRLFADVYQWVELAVSSGRLKNDWQAWNSLASACDVSYESIRTWFYAGKFMREQNIKPESVVSNAVLSARSCEGRVSAADFLKIVQAVKEGKKGGDVSRMVTRAYKKSGHEATRRAARAKADRRWNKRDLKLELMVIKGLMDEFFGAETEVAVCTKEGEILLEVS